MRNIVDAMPWSNTVDVVAVPGSTLKAILEHSVSKYDASHPDPGGRFLQVSGLSVTYDVGRDVGSRVVSAVLRATGDSIDGDEVYEIALVSFMAKGGDGVSECF